MRLTLAAACLLCLAAPLPAGDPLDELDEYVPAAMKEAGVPGLAVAVLKDDKLVLARGYGTREAGRDWPVDEQTVFAAGSVTKSFTAAALAAQVDKGGLAWDDPVARWLPGFRLADPATRDVTLRDLLCHRSGLPAYGGDLMFSAGLQRNDIVRRARFLKPDPAGFRGRMAYQNVMYLTAGQAAAAAAEAPWDVVVGERFFGPLSMTRTNTSVGPLAAVPNVARPHALIEGKPTPIDWRDLDSAGGAGAVNSTVTDLARWLRLHLGGGTVDGKRLLSEAVVKEMHSPQSVVKVEGWRAKLSPEANFRAYGLGWFLEDYRGKKVVHHGGNVDGMTAQAGMMPGENVGVVVLCNRDATFLPKALMYRVFDAFLPKADGPRRDWAKEFQGVWRERQDRRDAAERKAEEARVPGTKPSLPTPRYAGTYASELYGVLEVQNGEDGLTMKLGPRLVGRLEHWHHDTFLVRWKDPSDGRSLATFPLDSAGKVAGLSLEEFGEPGSDWQFARRPAPPG